jgi:hypothetical protein
MRDQSLAGCAVAEDGKAVYEEICINGNGPDGRSDTNRGKALKSPRFLEENKHKQISPQVSDKKLAAVTEYVRMLVTAGGK